MTGRNLFRGVYERPSQPIFHAPWPKYLHARRCFHRDLKGENLLVTPNGRLKITDFAFARITARNADEVKRLTFCGTDSYMSPEILLGEEFDLPTDVYSLGVIC